MRVAPTSISEAHVLQWLLNQPRGWLAQVTAEPKWGASARARVLSGGPVAALVIAVHAAPESVQPVIEQVRALLAQLARGSATARDVSMAESGLRKAEVALSRAPVERLISTWRGRSTKRSTIADFRRFAQRALAPSKHVVVTVRTRD